MLDSNQVLPDVIAVDRPFRIGQIVRFGRLRMKVLRESTRDACIAYEREQRALAKAKGEPEGHGVAICEDGGIEVDATPGPPEDLKFFYEVENL